MRGLRRRGGFSIPIAMAALAVFTLMIAGIYALMHAQVRETLYQARVAQAQAIAEAGLNDALYQIYLNSNWKAGYNKKAFAGGYYTVTLSTDINQPWVESTGYAQTLPGFGRAVKTVTAQASRNGIQSFADNTFNVIGSSVSSYDSAFNVAPQCGNKGQCGFGASVWANNAISASGTNPLINGDATYANAASTAPAASAVAGHVSYSPSTAAVSIVDGSPYLAANDNMTRINPASAYNSTTMVLTVAPPGHVSLSSGTFYFKGIVLTGTGSGSKQANLDINLNSSQSATVYLAGNMYVSTYSLVTNKSNYAQNFHIYGQGGNTIQLLGDSATKNGNTFYVDLYCPGDDIYISDRILGRVIGRNVWMYNAPHASPDYLFDRQFGYIQTMGVQWVSGSWSESFERQ